MVYSLSNIVKALICFVNFQAAYIMLQEKKFKKVLISKIVKFQIHQRLENFSIFEKKTSLDNH